MKLTTVPSAPSITAPPDEATTSTSRLVPATNQSCNCSSEMPAVASIHRSGRASIGTACQVDAPCRAARPVRRVVSATVQPARRPPRPMRAVAAGTAAARPSKVRLAGELAACPESSLQADIQRREQRADQHRPEQRLPQRRDDAPDEVDERGAQHQHADRAKNDFATMPPRAKAGSRSSRRRLRPVPCSVSRADLAQCFRLVTAADGQRFVAVFQQHHEMPLRCFLDRTHVLARHQRVAVDAHEVRGEFVGQCPQRLVDQLACRRGAAWSRISGPRQRRGCLSTGTSLNSLAAPRTDLRTPFAEL